MASYQARQRDPLLDQGMQAALERRGKELLGALLLGLGLIMALILGSYSPDDPSWLAATDDPARNLLGRFGAAIDTPHAALTRCFPDAATLASASAEAIGTLGIVRQRVGALQTLAREVHAGRIVLHRGAPLAATQEALRALPGIGEWSVQLISMRALAWPDAFPATDIGVLNALGTRDVKAVALKSQAWRPWRSYAVMRLWQSLETGT